MKHKNKAPTLSAGTHQPVLFWDCSNRATAPAVDKITKVHIFDFDNTLFKSPGPNPNLYNDQTIGLLTARDTLYGGGWWMNPLVLRNLGEGWENEVSRKWEGFWNEDVVELMKLSKQSEDTLTIVMTGRNKKLFTDLLMEILDAKDLTYDGLILKTGDFETTIEFKGQVITDILNHYKNVEQIVIYDDRKSQLNGFQTILNNHIRSTNSNLIYSLVPVFTEPEYLDPKTERKLVEETIESHNTAIINGESGTTLKKIHFKKSFLFTGYILTTDSKTELIRFLLDKFPDKFNEDVLETYRFQVDFIPFSRSLLPKQISVKLSGSPNQKWKVTHLGCEDDMIAVAMQPVENLGTEGFTNQLPPVLPICSRGKTSQKAVDDFLKIDNWLLVENGLEVDAQFGPIVLFKITADSSSSKKQKR